MQRAKALFVLLLALVLAGFVLLDGGQYLHLEALRHSHEALATAYAQHPWGMRAAYLGLYVAMAALSLPGAAVLTLAGGAVLGFGWGLLLVSFASSIGATLAFLAARWVLRDAVQARLGARLHAINAGVQRDGARYLLSLRLMPVVPYVVVNLAMGLTTLPVRTFYAVSQLGMLPGTAVYVHAGSQLAQVRSLSDVASPGVLAALGLLAVFPWLVKALQAGLRQRRAGARWRGQRPKRFDRNLIVIGAGAGGLVSAYIAAALKARVTLVEAHVMGGDCLNYGCVPSKALIQSAKLAHQMRHAQRYGLYSTSRSAGGPKEVFSFKSVMQRIEAIVAAIAPHDSVERYTALGVDVRQGYATIVNPWTVDIRIPATPATATAAASPARTERLTTRHIVLATGARPIVPTLPGLEQVDYLTSDTLWARAAQWDAVPARLLVLGGGPIGCELAQAFARLGAAVTLVEAGPRLLPREDATAAALVAQALRADGVTLLLGQRAVQVQPRADAERPSGGVLLVQDAQHNAEHTSADAPPRCIAFDQLLCAVGRRARLEGFGLEALGINTDGTLHTDAYLQTLCPSIYAAGDVVGSYQFTHTAAHQAWYATVNALFGSLKRFQADYRAIPSTVFTDPQVARVGLSVLEAQAQDTAFETTTYPLDELDRAITDSQTQGFVQVLTVPGRDTILGVTIVGSQAGDMLAEWVLAMQHGLGLGKVLSTVHAYPTWAEANKYAAGQWRRAHQPQRLLQWVRAYHDWMRR